MTHPAGIILNNANIITCDARNSMAQAIALADGKILAVGTDGSMTPHIGPQTRRLDVKGRTIVPGLIDSHAHMERAGLRTIFPSLGPVRSIKDIQDGIRRLAREKKAGEWIVTMPLGDPPYYRGLPESLSEKRWPTRQELDEAAPNNPVYIRSIWGYWRGTLPIVSFANTAALKKAGITRDTSSPVPSIEIEKDGNGDPTGVFFEHDYAPLVEIIWFHEAASFSAEDRLRTLPGAARAYHGFGTTSIFEGHGAASEVMRAYRRAHGAGKLTMRATLCLSPDWTAIGDAPIAPFVESWLSFFGEPGLGDDMLKIGGIYVHEGRTMADELRARAGGSYTGWAGFNSTHGLPRDKLKELLVHCARNDIRPTCITGHETVGMLDIYDEVDREISLRGRRWVVSHINVLSPRDIERIVRMGLVIGAHATGYIYKRIEGTAAHLPPEQHADIVPMKSLIDAGVTVTLCSDASPISLWYPIQHTVARRQMGSNRTFGETQALSRMEALRCATANGAYLTFDEDKKGTLEPGKFADLAVLSTDPLTVPVDQISEIEALMTMVDGRIVNEAPAWLSTDTDQFTSGQPETRP